MGENRSTADELADFLRARRAALTPETVGVPTYGQPRRVPGLRRDEVAQLAGISVNYYTRLEQGESHQMSDSVLSALAAALQLNVDEHAHLLRLARPAQTVRRGTGPETVRPSMLTLLESNTEQAAVLVGRSTNLLGANRLGYALYGLRPDQRPNLTKLMFLSPEMRDLLPDWPEQARNAASYLRAATSDHPDDEMLAALIGELSIKSTDFARIWAEHPVAECLHKTQKFRHPLVGELVLQEEILRLPDDPSQRLIFLGAEPGTPSAERLRLLDSLVS
ncbi:helix-turn-helix transcriptional regulator [Crossiella cryophila]|uniref:Transcriptional regulator with XRE-family HTH domain n=1 Tax=Crossiella cryophila TaxID=43355 RepID=A0A7W7CEJ8_9PSEU|nr:helix-turn-helix transcriptional regulator [Crossiella cryophila]MBB4679724.1 transcriptional regulator with XRE-family HTH domain [Crossiella cryophila]